MTTDAIGIPAERSIPKQFVWPPKYYESSFHKYIVLKELEIQNVTLLEQKNDLFLQLQTEQDNVTDLEQRVEQLVTQKADTHLIINSYLKHMIIRNRREQHIWSLVLKLSLQFIATRFR
jgi:hypothetical protein